jgi:hypothetical protein
MFAAEQTSSSQLAKLRAVRATSNDPIDLRLVLHDTLSDSHESSRVMLAKAGLDGTLQLLTSAWERVLGYAREEFKGKTLLDLMWSNPLSTAAAVAAILDAVNMSPVDLRLRCRSGVGKSLTLHRLYDKDEHTMYIVAEERPDPVASVAARTRRPGRATARKFAQMARRQKWIFVAKLVVRIVTFGFAFPNAQHDWDRAPLPLNSSTTPSCSRAIVPASRRRMRR